MKSFIEKIKKLSYDDKQKIIKLLSDNLYINDLDKYRSEHIGEKVKCTYCNSDKIVKNGSQNNVQKFRCKDCKKTFGLHTGTSIYWLHHKEDWGKFIELTLESKSIRDIAKELKHSNQTIFNWRHKLLSSLENIFQKEFKGVVEMDDMLVRFNQKGRVNNFNEGLRRKRKTKNKRGISNEQVSVLFTIDRYKAIDLRILKLGKINRFTLGNVLDKGLKSRLNKENVIVTDGCTSYKSCLNGFTHERLVLRKGQRVRGVYHLNTLNSHSRNFKNWIDYNFSSVSTKYLQNYLYYFKMIDFVLRENDEKSLDFLKTSLKDSNTFKRFHSIENKYESFFV